METYPAAVVMQTHKCRQMQTPHLRRLNLMCHLAATLQPSSLAVCFSEGMN